MMDNEPLGSIAFAQAQIAREQSDQAWTTLRALIEAHRELTASVASLSDAVEKLLEFLEEEKVVCSVCGKETNRSCHYCGFAGFGGAKTPLCEAEECVVKHEQFCARPMRKANR